LNDKTVENKPSKIKEKMDILNQSYKRKMLFTNHSKETEDEGNPERK